MYLRRHWEMILLVRCCTIRRRRCPWNQNPSLNLSLSLCSCLSWTIQDFGTSIANNLCRSEGRSATRRDEVERSPGILEEKTKHRGLLH